jgi:hypothetical protein
MRNLSIARKDLAIATKFSRREGREGMMLERRAGTSWMPSMRACGGYGRAISMVLEVAIPIAKEEGVSPATI